MMCISLFSYGSPVAVRCMGFGWVWVGLGHGRSTSSPGSGLGWVGSVCLWVGSWVMKMDPRTTLVYTGVQTPNVSFLSQLRIYTTRPI